MFPSGEPVYSDRDLKLVRDFETAHPDFFPADTPTGRKMDYIKTIRSKQNNDQMQKQEQFRKLDEATEAAQNKREAAKSQDELREQATEILRSGDPLVVFRQAFSLNHCGDDEILRAVIYATILQSSRTTKGLQIFITGDSGSGKSSAVKSAVHLIPPEKITEGSFSDKAFFMKLAGKNKPVVYLDDITLSDPQVATIKRSMTNFQKLTDHHTIIDHKLVVETIPSRTLWLGSAVGEAGDDQLKNRYLSLGIQNSPENDQEYCRWELQRRKEGRPEDAVNDDVILSRAILQHIADKEFVVIGLDKIEFGYMSDRRLVNILLDLMEANAVLYYLQREHEEKDGVIFIHPAPGDLDSALNFSMFNFVDKTSQGRLTKAERALDDAIQAQIGDRTEREFTEAAIVDLFQKSVTRIRTLLYGRDGTAPNIKGGLCEKCPWYSLDSEADTHKNIIRVKRHIHKAFDQFARVTP